MKISRDADGFRFIAECAAETGFMPEDVHCARCGRRIDPLSGLRDLSFRCRYCGFRGKSFLSETDLHNYFAEQWDLLRQACSHPSVIAARG
jgi:recombinational DNA repair protein (RecF pathway)